MVQSVKVQRKKAFINLTYHRNFYKPLLLKFNMADAEQKAKYIKRRNDYLEKSKRIKEFINIEKTVIEKLEKDLENLIPRFDGCDEKIKCPDCKVYSLKQGRFPEDPTDHLGLDFYRCEICNNPYWF